MPLQCTFSEIFNEDTVDGNLINMTDPDPHEVKKNDHPIFEDYGSTRDRNEKSFSKSRSPRSPDRYLEPLYAGPAQFSVQGMTPEQTALLNSDAEFLQM